MPISPSVGSPLHNSSSLSSQPSRRGVTDVVIVADAPAFPREGVGKPRPRNVHEGLHVRGHFGNTTGGMVELSSPSSAGGRLFLASKAAAAKTVARKGHDEWQRSDAAKRRDGSAASRKGKGGGGVGFLRATIGCSGGGSDDQRKVAVDETRGVRLVVV